jgi:uncharacterized membrane protein YbaN (DUF454 family)
MTKVFRPLFFVFGLVFLVVGMIGVVTPVLPTTPFLILSAGCFANSSPQFHLWLTEHKTFGPPVRAWQERRAISQSAKILATILIAVNLAVPLFLLGAALPWYYYLIVGICVSVLIYLWTRPNS